MEHGVMIVEACTREEREEGARGEDHQENQAEVVQPTVVRPDICNYPARTIRPPDYPASQEGRQVSARSATPRWSDRIFPIIRPSRICISIQMREPQRCTRIFLKIRAGLSGGPDYPAMSGRIIRPWFCPNGSIFLGGINTPLLPPWAVLLSLSLSSIVELEKLALSLNPSMILAPI